MFELLVDRMSPTGIKLNSKLDRKYSTKKQRPIVEKTGHNYSMYGRPYTTKGNRQGRPAQNKKLTLDAENNKTKSVASTQDNNKLLSKVDDYIKKINEPL